MDTFAIHAGSLKILLRSDPCPTRHSLGYFGGGTLLETKH